LYRDTHEPDFLMMLLGRSTDGLIYVFERPVRLLVVDDDPIMREFAIAQLSHPGGEIVTAGDGEEAWARLQEDARFDLVLSDLEMPVMNGFALVEQIRSSPRHAHLPVVVITSRDDMFAIDRAYEVGATSFATKPVNWRLLGYQLRYVLRGWRMEAQVRRAHEDAERTSRLRDSLLTLLQHETRTPLNAIVGYVELLQKAGVDQAGMPLPFLDDLKQAGLGLNRILQRVFYFAQLNSGVLELEQENISIAGLIEEVTRTCAQRASSCEVDLRALIDPPSLRVMADHDHLTKALNELVTNALASSPAASHVLIKAGCDSSGNVFVEISDEGKGLEEAELLICKKPFVQVEDPLTRWKGGLGLGIPTARRVVEMHGGSLAFAPSSAGGVTARITLPGPAGRGGLSSDHGDLRSDRTAA
jgi:two-component system, sensor histidine kinase and response regulator